MIEGGIILLAVTTSYFILNSEGGLGVVEIDDALIRGVVIAFFCQSCMYMLDMYDLKHSHPWGELFFSLLFAVGFVCVGIGIVSFAFPAFAIEGPMYFLTILFVAAFLLAWRIAFDIYLARFAPRESILVLGTGSVSKMVAREIKERERLGFRLAGFVGGFDGGNGNGTETIGPYLGDVTRLEKIVDEHKVRRIVAATGNRRGEYPVKEMLAVRVGGCRMVEWPGFFEKLSGRIPIDSLAPSFFIFNEGFRKSKATLFIRRIFSTIMAAIALVVVSPLVLVTAVLIKIDSRGPVFYSQARVGQKGKVFKIIKFRSMRRDAEQDGGPRWAAKGDPRVTRVGRIIRPLRIDELPQMLNILRGDIDLVGPRPERPEFVAELEKLIPYYSLRHTVKPGLTGWAQVMFMYCGTIEEAKEKLQYDLFYIKNMSIKLDLLILFKTLKIVILGRGAR